MRTFRCSKVKSCKSADHLGDSFDILPNLLTGLGDTVNDSLCGTFSFFTNESENVAIIKRNKYTKGVRINERSN